MTVIGSRQHMCINPRVTARAFSNVRNSCRRLTKKHMCRYKNNITQDSTIPRVMDIEELKQHGIESDTCPYFLTRNEKVLHEADLVLMPYNYLIDSSVRGNLELNWSNAIVIIDEAHNLASVCESATSIQLKALTITHCIEELDNLLTKSSLEDGADASSFSSQQKDILTMKDILLKLENSLMKFELKRISFGNGLGVVRQAGHILEMCNQVGLNITTAQYLIETLKQWVEDNEIPNLEHILKVLQRIFLDGKQPYGSLYQRVNDNFMMFISQEKKRQPYQAAKQNKGGLFSFNFTREETTSDEHERVLNLWCFNPGLALNEMKSFGVSSVILTSGTLSPLSSFKELFKLPFPQRLENSHVINKSQLFLCTATKGPFLHSLNSSYRTRNKKEYKLELGNSILSICRHSPNGVLVFFPSYTVMNACLTHWKEDSSLLYNRLEEIKTICEEPKTTKELTPVISKFSKESLSKKGAVLFCVCRGKVSEGIDFSDHRCRTVVITGLPFPPLKDPKIHLKRAHLDKQKNSVLNGNNWYMQQASSAVNQAIGRVIRHKADFGAIVLLDERFSSAQQKQHLSKWLRPQLNCYKDFLKLERDLSSFFENCKKNLSLKHTTSLHTRVGEDEVQAKADLLLNMKPSSELCLSQYSKKGNKSTKRVMKHLQLGYETGEEKENYQQVKKAKSLRDLSSFAAISGKSCSLLSQRKASPKEPEVISLLDDSPDLKRSWKRQPKELIPIPLQRVRNYTMSESPAITKVREELRSGSASSACMIFLNKARQALNFVEYARLKELILDLAKNQRTYKDERLILAFREFKTLVPEELKEDLCKFLPKKLKKLFRQLVLNT